MEENTDNREFTNVPKEEQAYADQTHKEDRKCAEARKEVIRTLDEMGFEDSQKGYSYLAEGILFCVEQPDLLNAITKELYPKIAEERKTTALAAERAIRRLIKSTWESSRLAGVETDGHACRSRICGYRIKDPDGLPTNRELIAIVTDKVMMELARRSRFTDNEWA